MPAPPPKSTSDLALEHPASLISATTVYGETMTAAFQPKCYPDTVLTFVGQVGGA